METHPLTPIKVGPVRALSNGGQLWPVIVREEFPGELAVYAEAGARDLEAHRDETVELELERGKDFRGTPQWKVIRSPGWQRGSGRPGGGGGMSPEERREIQRMASLHAASRLAASGLLASGPGETIQEATVRVAEAFCSWLTTPALPAAQPEPRSEDDGAHAHSWAQVDGRPGLRRCITCNLAEKVPL